MNEDDPWGKNPLLASLARYENETRIYGASIRKALDDPRRLPNVLLLPEHMFKRVKRIDFSQYRPVPGGPEQLKMRSIGGMHQRLSADAWKGPKLDLPDRPKLTEMVSTRIPRFVEKGEPLIDQGVSAAHDLTEWAGNSDAFLKVLMSGSLQTTATIRQPERHTAPVVTNMGLIQMVGTAAIIITSACVAACAGTRMIARRFGG